MRRRRPLGKGNTQGVVTRDEFEELKAELRRLGSQVPSYISLVETVSDDPDIDDSYGFRFGGTADAADEVDTSDGLAPDAVEFAPVVEGGVSFLAIKWRAVPNADQVTYEVHLSKTSGFTPSAATLRAETLGTLLFLRQQPANAILNASAESDLTGWESKLGATLTQSTDQAIQGTHSIKVDCPGVDASEGVQATFDGFGLITGIGGRRYTFSAYIYSTTARDFALKWNEYDAASAYVTTKAGTVSHTGTGWERLSLSADTDATCTQIQPSVEAGSAAAVVFYVDGLMFEYEPDLSDYTENNDPVLVRGDTYYVKIVAKDDDGSASASPEGVGQLAQVTSDDIAANAVTAEKILAGEIDAEHLAAVIVLATSLLAGTEGGSRVEVGLTEMMEGEEMVGIHAFDTDGETITFMLDAATGQVYVKGDIAFGTASRLLPNDIIELKEQPTSFETPAAVQKTSGRSYNLSGIASGATISRTFGRASVTGSLLLCVVSQYKAGTTTPSAVSTPSGFTLIDDQTWSGTFGLGGFNGRMRQQVFAREDAPATSTISCVTGANTPSHLLMSTYEFQGVALSGALDKEVGTTGNTTDSSTPIDPGTTATLTVGGELVFAAVSHLTHDDEGYPPIYTAVDWDGVDVFYGEIGSPAVSHSQYGTVPLLTHLSAYGTAPDTDPPVFKLTPDIDYVAAPWIAYLVTFTAKAAGVDAPDTTKLRVFGKYATSPDVTSLHAVSEDGVENSVFLAPADERWRAEIYEIDYNAANILAHAGGALQSFSAPGVEVGDLVMFAGASPRLPSSLVPQVTSPADAADTIKFQLFNADSSGQDDPNRTYSFFVIHKS